MATTSLQTLIDRTRRYARDWPDVDTLSGAVTNAATTIPVVGTGTFVPGDKIEVEQETMIVRAVVGLNLTVRRGAFGSAPVSHLGGAAVLQNPKYFAAELIDALSDGVDAAFPYVYRFVDAEFTLQSNVWEYAVPVDSETGDNIVSLYELEYRFTGQPFFTPYRKWRTKRLATPVIQLTAAPVAGATARVYGVTRFPRLASVGSLDAQWPGTLEYPLVEYAGSWVMASGELASAATGETTDQSQTTTNQHGEVIAQGHNTSVAQQHGESILTTPNTDSLETLGFDGGTDDTHVTGTQTEAHSGTDTQTTTGTDTETHSGTDTQTEIATQSVTRVGAHAAAQSMALQRFLRRIANSGYPPMPRRRVG